MTHYLPFCDSPTRCHPLAPEIITALQLVSLRRSSSLQLRVVAHVLPPPPIWPTAMVISGRYACHWSSAGACTAPGGHTHTHTHTFLVVFPCSRLCPSKTAALQMPVKGANAGWKFIETLQRWCSFEKTLVLVAIQFWLEDFFFFLFAQQPSEWRHLSGHRLLFVSLLLLLHSILLSCTILVSLLSSGHFADVTAVCFPVTFEEQRLMWLVSCSEVTASFPFICLASWHRAAAKPFHNLQLQGSGSEVSSNNTVLSTVSLCRFLSIPICYR